MIIHIGDPMQAVRIRHYIYNTHINRAIKIARVNISGDKYHHCTEKY